MTVPEIHCFICEDCHVHVTRYGGALDTLCCTCRFLRDNPETDEATRRRLRGEDRGQEHPL